MRETLFCIQNNEFSTIGNPFFFVRRYCTQEHTRPMDGLRPKVIIFCLWSIIIAVVAKGIPRSARFLLSRSNIPPPFPVPSKGWL